MARPIRRGGPILLLTAIGVAWILLRILLWENPFPAPVIPQLTSPIMADRSIPDSGRPRPDSQPAFTVAAEQAQTYWSGLSGSAGLGDSPQSLDQEGDQPRIEHAGFKYRAGHPFLFLAAMRQTTAPAGPGNGGLPMNGERHKGLPPTAASDRADRWSVDVWTFWRDGAGLRTVVASQPTYGGSQFGAVAQYRLDQASQVDPRVYLRGYGAIANATEIEIASGLSARPVAKVPVRVHGELRLAHRSTGQEVRAAVFVTSEIQPVALPLQARGEVYAQAGYVSGQFDTLFVDAQAQVSRGMGDFDLAKIRAGGGIWLGAQRGAARLDLGPTLRMDLAIGDHPASVAVDWRERVAGNAAPSSGIAATFSTRF